MMVIVPNHLAAELNARLDAALAECPAAAKDRDALYGQLLAYVNEHGTIPDFTVGKSEAA